MKYILSLASLLSFSCLNNPQTGTEVDADPNAKGCPCSNSVLGAPDAGVLCPKADPANRCMALEVTLKEETRMSAKTDLKGAFRWAVYHGGDVQIPQGPVADKIRGGDIEMVDFNLRPGGPAKYIVSVGDYPPAWYQALGYLDEDENGDSNGGDIVMFPEKPFALKPGTDLIQPMQLNYIR